MTLEPKLQELLFSRISNSPTTTIHLRTIMSNKDKQIMSGTADVLVGCQGGQLAETSNPRRRSGKELCEEMGTDTEKKAMVIIKAKSRGAARVRFLAVGLFLSVLTVSSEQLIKTMKKIWKIRGLVDMSPMEGRRFVLDFAEEGDFLHVTRGGPWRYRKDAVLIEALKEGEEPDAVNFSSVPIWVQFKEIPFYLLSKELARDLGKRMCELIFIDNDSRGDLLAKFLRARVRLPLDTPLLRWAKLMDEIAKEEVVASVFYERLPTFCKCCGIIGHQAANCSLPAERRSNNYEPELGVPPTHYKDTPRWFLPKTTGQERRPLYKFLAWDNVSEPAAPPNLLMRQRHLAIVSHVAKEVGKLTVNEPATVTKAREEQAAASSPTVSVASKQLCYEVQTKAPDDTNTVVPHEAHGEAAIDNQAEAPLHNEVQAKATGDTYSEGPHEEQGEAISDNNAEIPPLRKNALWKRMAREKNKAESKKEACTTQGAILGATRQRAEEEDEDRELHQAKKILIPVPSLAECLGEENLRKLREQEESDSNGVYNLYGRRSEKSVDQEKSVSLEIVVNEGDEDELGDRDVKVKQGQDEAETEADIDTSQRLDGMKLGAKASARQKK
ncbi:hypothetical protein QYE76_064723 [Lolium multiflorum]|uniref:CCHC-type domain-containing protein n=1 Tax=Lolium multiflorum TaxID=4521 RepID=A0AAD8S8V5_LOLMU|nr:hypothetical protein QYE76_064723 [Lolium multiflorum]